MFYSVMLTWQNTLRECRGEEMASISQSSVLTLDVHSSLHKSLLENEIRNKHLNRCDLHQPAPDGRSRYDCSTGLHVSMVMNEYIRGCCWFQLRISFNVSTGRCCTRLIDCNDKNNSATTFWFESKRTKQLNYNNLVGNYVKVTRYN